MFCGTHHSNKDDSKYVQIDVPSGRLRHKMF